MTHRDQGTTIYLKKYTKFVRFYHALTGPKLNAKLCPRILGITDPGISHELNGATKTD